MRLGLTILIVLHGAIHLVGFLKWSRLATVQQLKGRTVVPLTAAGDRAFAILWLVALLALLAAAGLRFVRHDAWWVPALGGVVLSQGLIVFAWHDARFGTVANLLILVPAVVAAAHTRFSQWTGSEIRTLLTQSLSAPDAIVEQSELERLPTPVRRWLEVSGVVGRERARVVRLKQRGELRTSPDAAWIPARAEQYFSVEPPGFIWRVDATMMGILPVTGRDKYVAGHGHMLIKAASVVNVVDAADDKIDQGSMLRFLGEIVWFPSAALSRYLAWDPIDERSATATIRYGGLAASAVFTFDVQGRVVSLRAERYLGGGADAKLTPWIVTCSEWRVFQGVEIPNRGDVGWTLASGEFTYYRWEILDVEFNRAELYGKGTAPSLR